MASLWVKIEQEAYQIRVEIILRFSNFSPLKTRSLSKSPLRIAPEIHAEIGLCCMGAVTNNKGEGGTLVY
jgi:hypothetical protein